MRDIRRMIRILFHYTCIRFDDPISSDILFVSTIGSNDEKNHFKYKKRFLQISSIFVRIPRYSS